MDTFNFDKTATTFNKCHKLLVVNSNQIKPHCKLPTDFWFDMLREYVTDSKFNLQLNQYKELLKFPPFNEYVKLIKQNRLAEIKIPYDERVLRKYLQCIDIYGFGNCSQYMRLRVDNHLKFTEQHDFTVWAMIMDGEFAYTWFYYYKFFQQFEPFIKHKQNYEQRHYRLCAVHEHMFDSYDNSYGSVKMVFSNDYLIRIIMRFL